MQASVNRLLEDLREVLDGIKTGEKVKILARISKGTTKWMPDNFRKDSEVEVTQGSSVGGILGLRFRMNKGGSYPFRLRAAKDQSDTFWLIDEKFNRKLRVRVVR
jgi:hypothetical protein